MITITSIGTKLVVRVDIPKDLASNQHYALAADLGGSEIAVRALANRLEHELSERIKQIRLDAYRQGARDRANRCTDATGWLGLTDRGGCC